MGSLLLGLGALCAYAYSIHPYGLHYALLGLLFAFFSFLVLSYLLTENLIHPLLFVVKGSLLLQPYDKYNL
jgi:1,4-dihydroxy-2-naphthoate octaprenyltransferase